MKVIKKKISLYQLAACLAALFLLAVIVLLRIDIRDDGKITGTLKLWYVEDDYLTALLTEAGDAGVLSGTGLSLSIRSFESEQELADALDIERPEMLWCTSDTAEALSLNGSLTGISDSISLPEGYSLLSGNAAFEAGEFYPVRLDAEVLAYKSGAFDDDGSFEKILSAAMAASGDSVPVFACSSWYSLFEAIVSGSGAALSGDMLENSENESFVSTYNSLAGLALSGGLYSGEASPLEALSEGDCLFCAVTSAELESEELSADYALCIPYSDGCVSAEATGFAITAEDPAYAAACGTVIERLLSVAAQENAVFPVAGEVGAFPEGTEMIIIKGYVPGLEALALEFDEEISRRLSILCE